MGQSGQQVRGSKAERAGGRGYAAYNVCVCCASVQREQAISPWRDRPWVDWRWVCVREGLGSLTCPGRANATAIHVKRSGSASSLFPLLATASLELDGRAGQAGGWAGQQAECAKCAECECAVCVASCRSSVFASVLCLPSRFNLLRLFPPSARLSSACSLWTWAEHPSDPAWEPRGYIGRSARRQCSGGGGGGWA